MTQTLLADLPTYLSPSRAAQFRQCPRRFFYRSVCKIPDPSGPEALRGSVFHSIAQHTFELPAADRTRDNIMGFVDRALADNDIEADNAAYMADQMRDLVVGWLCCEDPRRFNPVGVELWVRATLGGVDTVGIIDRLDRVEHASGVRWYISDYKAGAFPAPSRRRDAFAASRLYAALVRELCGIEVSQLRLVYVGERQVLTEDITPADMDRAIRTHVKRWEDIEAAHSAGLWPARPSPLCAWCPYMEMCPTYASGVQGVDGVPVPAEGGVEYADVV